MHGVFGQDVGGLAAPGPLGQLALVVGTQEFEQVAVAGAVGEELQQAAVDLADVEVAAQGFAELEGAAAVEFDERVGVGAGEREPFGDQRRVVGGPDAQCVAGAVGQGRAGEVEGELPDFFAGAGQAQQPVADEGGGRRRRSGGQSR